jgi:hypothetical protein
MKPLGSFLHSRLEVKDMHVWYGPDYLKRNHLSSFPQSADTPKATRHKNRISDFIIILVLFVLLIIIGIIGISFLTGDW